MATWQFDLHLLPAVVISDLYRGIPLAIPRADFDSRKWWPGTAAPTNLGAELNKLLPPLTSWNSSLEQWGDEDGNRIDVLWDNRSIVDIFIRIDSISHVFLVGLLEVTRTHDWLLRTQDGRVLRPFMSKLLSAIPRSDAFRFVEDPRAFFEALEKANLNEPDGGAT